MTDYISRSDGIEFIKSLVSTMSVCVSADECSGMKSMQKRAIGALRDVPAADVVEVDDVARMLTWFFDDHCPCNYNGIDEWLPYTCEILDECPDPKDKMACWKQFVKHYKRRRDGDA